MDLGLPPDIVHDRCSAEEIGRLSVLFGEYEFDDAKRPRARDYADAAMDEFARAILAEISSCGEITQANGIHPWQQPFFPYHW